MLYIVPTPIGNLEDITLRAIRVLKEVDAIYAEDTRTSGKLLKHFEIDNQLRSFHSFNEHKIVDQIITDLKNGKKYALISDAGTPAISDPGFLLSRACVEAQVPVTCLPGATAFVPALVASGLTSDKFFFEGFLPHKKGRQTRLKYLATLESTFILYESPHRLVKCLDELIEFCGPDRRASVGREISKLFEEFKTDTLSNLLNYYTTDGITKGEIVICIAGAEPVSKNDKKKEGYKKE
jgi:16S rRNA (cytidine1402-2'-O)-methyltransferase